MNVHTAAELSALAYRKRTLKARSSHDMWVSVKRGRDIDTQAYCTVDEHGAWIAFRGSESPEDWLTNVQAVLVPGPYGDVHKGFQDALHPLLVPLTKWIEDHGSHFHDLHLVGHSLGGALADLFAAELLSHTGAPFAETVITFGAPRVGSTEYARHFADCRETLTTYLRVVNEHDIVPHLPPFGDFEHATAQHEHLVLPPPEREHASDWSALRTSAEALLARTERVRIKSHHVMGGKRGYLARVKECC